MARFARRVPSVVLVAGALALSSCKMNWPGGFGPAVEATESVSPGANGTLPAETPSPTPRPVSGGVIWGEDDATPAPRRTPEPTPTPGVEMSVAPRGPFVVGVAVTPATASIRFAASDSALPAIGPSSVQLEAQVTLTNGLKSTQVTWSSTNPAIATVDFLGLARAGTTEGTVQIVATSVLKTPEGLDATGSCRVTVSGRGDVDLIVE